MSDAVTIVDGASLPWVNGVAVYESMEPAFRENLGRDRDAALELLSQYHMRGLWLDPTTSRRIDHIRTDPGYEDLSEAYHDSVEESYFLGGTCELTAEGHFEAGDYFWRPPGWVHSATSPTGFDSLLMMEGEDLGEESARVSRVVRPDEEAGRLGRSGGDGIGPRGYVRRLETRFMVWRDHDDRVTRLGNPGGLRAKVLSANAATGAASLLVRPEPDWRSTPSAVDRDRFVVNTHGTLVADGRTLAEPSLVHIPAGATAPALHATDSVELLVKVGGPR
jgi:hypothetical protein